jgi:hypothetical protein
MRTARPFSIALAVLLAAGCNADAFVGGPDLERVYVQVERLGNPLVSEVTLAKRNHAFHNTTGPGTDVVNFSDQLKGFVRDVAGRNATVQNTLAAVLLPDMLIVQTDKAGSSAGWLSWALADGYGGRRLSDDVVDAGLAAIFGPLLDGSNVSPGLATDNVNANDAAFGTAFPYLAAAH